LKVEYVVANICYLMFFKVANRSIEVTNLLLAAFNLEPCNFIFTDGRKMFVASRYCNCIFGKGN